MRTVEEQVKQLRYIANGMEIGSYSESILIDVLNKAADTIETLSEKLQAHDREYESIIQEIGEKVFCVEAREYYSDSVVLHDDVEEVIRSHMKGGSNENS